MITPQVSKQENLTRAAKVQRQTVCMLTRTIPLKIKAFLNFNAGN